MSGVFKVTPYRVVDDDDGERFVINPLNVVLVRPRYEPEEMHVEQCDRGFYCPLSGIENDLDETTVDPNDPSAFPNDPSAFQCAYAKGRELAEIVFVGVNASVLVTETTGKLMELLNEFLRGRA